MSSDQGPAVAPRRVRLMTAVVLLGIFAAGVLTGAAAGRLGHPPGLPPEAGPPPGPPPGAPRLPPPWRGLGLDPDQTEKAMVIARRHRPEVEAVLRETFPRIHEIQRAMDGELVDILRPEQRARLEELQRHPPPRVPLE